MKTPEAGKSPRILVIDDSRATLNLATAYLQRVDLQVITATSAAEGMALAQTHQPDLVVCDVVLPDQNGFAFVTALRANPLLAGTPVVLMSAVSAMQDRMRAIESGADDMLTKPFDQAELISRVRALLRLKAREDALQQANRQLRERMYLMSILFMVGNELRESLDPADIYGIVRQTLVTVAGAESFTIYLRVEESTMYRAVASRGLGATDPGLLNSSGLPPPLAAALKEGKPFLYNYDEAETVPRQSIRAGSGPPAVLCLTPLVGQGIPIGFVLVYAFAPDRGDLSDFELLALLSGQITGALQQTRLYSQVQQYTKDLHVQEDQREGTRSLEEQMFHLKTLSLFSTQLHSTINVPQIYAAMRDLLVNIIGVSSFFIAYYQEESGIDSYAGVADSDTAATGQSDIARYLPLVRYVRETGAAIFFHGQIEPAVRALMTRHLLPTPFACLPLLVDQHVLGVLVIEGMMPNKHELRKEDYDLLALLCREAAVALHNGYVHQHVERLSRTDALTGAYNRRHFDLQLRAEVQRSQRRQTSLSLALCDVDDFKKVNDVHGHAVGDQVLRDIVRRLSSTLRESDVVARYGGEEFALILPDTTLAAAGVVAERVRRAVNAKPVQAGALALAISISAGIASLPPCLDDLSLILAADEALGQAKRIGKNQVVAAPPDQS